MTTPKRVPHIYLGTGYVDVASILDVGATFTFIIGGRGTGKTYGSLLTIPQKFKNFIYLRRTQEEVELATSAASFMYAQINDDFGKNIYARKENKKIYTLWDFEENGGEFGQVLSLTGVAHLRGFSSKAEIIVYDEFITEPHVRAIKHEAMAFFNICETIGRNRELNGKPPLRALLMSNSDNINNQILSELNLIGSIEKMRRKDEETCLIRRGGASILVVDLSGSPISKMKKTTTLYALTEGTRFKRMAVENDFGADFTNVKYFSTKEFKVIAQVGAACLYKHKSQGFYYWSYHRSGSPEFFEPYGRGVEAFRAKYGWVIKMGVLGKVLYENMEIKSYLTGLLGRDIL